ncbi:MAG: hypothetical protein EG825_04685 [Rhodocyclaceae bacterium]|nr:hypothetical protein [Rhodocyclaceae bacterium]
MSNKIIRDTVFSMDGIFSVEDVIEKIRQNEPQADIDAVVVWAYLAGLSRESVLEGYGRSYRFHRALEHAA